MNLYFFGCTNTEPKAKQNTKTVSNSKESTEESSVKLKDDVKPLLLIKTSQGNIYLELYPEAAPETVKNIIGLAEGKKKFTDIKTKKKSKRPFYDGLTFHRVIDEFMIQGGCPAGDGSGHPGYKFKDEINAEGLKLDEKKVIVNNQLNPWLPVRNRKEYEQMVLLPLLQQMKIKTQEEMGERAKEIETALQAMSLMKAYENMGFTYNNKLKAMAPEKGTISMANSGPNTNGCQFFINLKDNLFLSGRHTTFGRVVKGMNIVEKIAKVDVDKSKKPLVPVEIISIRTVDKLPEEK